MGLLLVNGYRELAEGVGNAPTSGLSRFCFRDRRSQLISACPPENWLPDLDSHQDKRLNRPPCYFHTTWQWRCRQDSHLHRSA